MSDTYTCSVWRISPSRRDEFIEAFQAFAAGATALGGAREGMILEVADDPGHFFVLRRWDDADAVRRWQGSSEQQTAGQRLRAIMPEAQEAHLMKRVASLGQ